MEALNAATPATERVNGRRNCGEQLAGELKQSNSAQPSIVQVLIEVVGAGQYLARIDGESLCASTRQPFLDAARVLLKRGCDPKGVMAMYRPGDVAWSLRASIGCAAGLTVNESRTAFAPWKAFCRAAVSPLVAQTESAATLHHAEAA